MELRFISLYCSNHRKYKFFYIFRYGSILHKNIARFHCLSYKLSKKFLGDISQICMSPCFPHRGHDDRCMASRPSLSRSHQKMQQQYNKDDNNRMSTWQVLTADFSPLHCCLLTMETTVLKYKVLICFVQTQTNSSNINIEILLIKHKQCSS